IPVMVSGCLGDDAKTTLVPSDPFGTASRAGSADPRPTLDPPTTQTAARPNPAGPVTRTSIRPAPAESAVRVDLLGRKILGFNPPDRTRLAELAVFEQDRRHEAAPPLPPPDPDLLARTYRQKAGFYEADLKAAQPHLQAAAANMTFEKQMAKPPASSWGN